MKPRLLVLTAGYGEGHNAAARAVSQAHEARHGAGLAPIADVFALAAPRLNAVVRRSYLGLINRAPHLWSAVYGWLDRSSFAPHLMRSLRRETRTLAAVIERERPSAICATYPAYAFMLAALRARGRVAVPCFSVVTDSISINSLWWRAGSDGWFVPNEDSAEVMRRAGVDAGRLHVLGFPVPPFFAAHAGRLAPPSLALGAAPRVLYIINSGTRAAAEIARRLITDTCWNLTCTVGRNAKLRAELTSLAAGRRHPVSILGWTDEIPRLLMTHHVVISKAGGATTQEALAARCPMIVNQIVPGQEEGNCELLRRHGVGTLAETPDAVVRALQRAFADDGRVWSQWRAALMPISRPDAARDIATAIDGHGAARTAPEPVPMPLRTATVSA
jgi:processive 1,2-diacylglycerol beta-glucosyltransferase